MKVDKKTQGKYMNEYGIKKSKGKKKKDDKRHRPKEVKGLSRATRAANNKRWLGWRESDGVTYPVTGSGAKNKNNI